MKTTPMRKDYLVNKRYTTVKGVFMFNRRWPCVEQNETHVTLFVLATGERVSFARTEVFQ
jgi:hypothetical protein